MGKAWRSHGPNFGWTNEYSAKLRNDVMSIKNNKVTYTPTILMFGHIGHGKSAFINSISSIYKRVKSNIANSGQSSGHVTSVFERYHVKDQNGTDANVRLADVKGIEKNKEDLKLVKTVIEIVNGHIKPGYSFDKEGEVHEYRIPEPTNSDKIHCVIVVIDCRFVQELKSGYLCNVKDLLDELNRRGVPRIAVLTHIDLVDSSAKKDITKVFFSEKILEKVKYVTEVYGIPFENIHPVTNHDNTSNSTGYQDPLVNIPLLLALKQALHFASENIDKMEQHS